MKIVHIITRLILGGAQENTLITCKLLAERGHEVTLITGPALGPEGELFNQTRGQKYETIVVDEMRRAIEPFKDLVAYRKLKRLLRQLQPDIVPVSYTHLTTPTPHSALNPVGAMSLKEILDTLTPPH